MTSVTRGTKKRKLDLPKDPTEARNPYLLRDLIEGVYRYWAGDFYRYVGPHYEKVSDDQIEKVIENTLEEVAEHYSNTRQFLASGSVFHNVKRAFRTSRTVDSGPESLLATTNGFLKIENDGTPTLLPADSDRFVVGSTGYPYVPGASSEKWQRFLAEVLPNSPELIAILQEFSGYCLTLETSLSAFLILQGEGSNGKSVFLWVLKLLIGELNTSTLSYKEMGDRFAPFETLGKRVNISPEFEMKDCGDEGRIKSFVSGEPMMFERKYCDPIRAAPTAKLVLPANELPPIRDRSNGMWRRIILVPFSVTIPKEQQIPEMCTDVYWQSELPGILNWALEGLQRLKRTGRFTESKTVETALDEYKTEKNPARAFILDHYEFDPSYEGYTRADVVYDKYVVWLGRNGHKVELSNTLFGKELRRAIPELPQSKLKKIKGKDVRVYYGLRPKT